MCFKFLLKMVTLLDVFTYDSHFLQKRFHTSEPGPLGFLVYKVGKDPVDQPRWNPSLLNRLVYSQFSLFSRFFLVCFFFLHPSCSRSDLYYLSRGYCPLRVESPVRRYAVVRKLSVEANRLFYCKCLWLAGTSLTIC